MNLFKSMAHTNLKDVNDMEEFKNLGTQIKAKVEDKSNIQIGTEALSGVDDGGTLASDPNIKQARNTYYSYKSNEAGGIDMHIFINENINITFPYVIHLLNRAKQEDNITLEFSNASVSPINSYTLACSITACKGNITTHANTILCITDLLLWILGRKLTTSRDSLIIAELGSHIVGGNISDIAVITELLKNDYISIRQILLDRGIMTAEELNEVFTNNRSMFVSGSLLSERLK